MKRARKAPEVPLTQLRLSDLLRAPANPRDRRLANLKVPADLLLRVHGVARELGVTKTAATIALLNEGLQAARRHGVGSVSARRTETFVRRRQAAR
ncbi:MAG: hypothetical protein ACHQ4J_02630 [Candidatus Binatia bacterium]